MIAIDTNILVYAHRREMPLHHAAVEVVRGKAEGQELWAVPWPCVHEFLAIVTNARIFKTPTPVNRAIDQLREWLRAPSVRTLAEDADYMETLTSVLASAGVSGAKVHDARIAALCIHHGLAELWTADRDFSRFANLRTRNPLMSPERA